MTNVMKTYSFSNSGQPADIMLWGPTNAGKDWLFHAFNKELAYYNQIDRDFHYEIFINNPGDPTPVPLPPAPPPAYPTTYAEDLNYSFQRVPMLQDNAHKISAHAHQIIIHNDKGANLVDSLNDPFSFESTFLALTQARNLILVLDIPSEENAPTQTAEPPQPQPDSEDFAQKLDDLNGKMTPPPADNNVHSAEAQSRSWSRAEYLKFMQLLLSILARTDGRNLAVCMSKSDKLNYRGDPWQVLSRRYGAEMARLLQINQQKHQIEVFLTSAAGFARFGGRIMPNINGDSKVLIDEKRWNPVNTAAPFFWIFEKIERERLGKGFVLFRGSNQKNYIPYPTPRPF